MQESALKANEERQRQGFDALTLIGWAETPSYDSPAHKLYWAKELAFGSHAEHTLNYTIRVLGQRGVLVLTRSRTCDSFRRFAAKRAMCSQQWTSTKDITTPTTCQAGTRGNLRHYGADRRCDRCKGRIL
jgi:uncharacterized membrane-anchored protein